MLERFVDSDDKIHKVATRGLRAVKNTGTLAGKTNRNRIEPRGGGMVVKEIGRKLLTETSSLKVTLYLWGGG